jgi:hypothetical protein
MQTFVPYPDIEKSLNCLDYRRLGKQRVEAFQIRNILTGNIKPNPRTGKIAWSNHPAVNMWRGYEDALTFYMNMSIRLWIKRGYKNNMLIIPEKDSFDLPPWFGTLEIVHSSHRANLLRKDYKFYSQYGWSEDPSTPYYWPVEQSRNTFVLKG